MYGLCTRGIAAAAGELPDQPAVDRAKGQIARRGQAPGTRDMVQNPLQLGARKIGIYQQAGFCLNQLCFSVGAQLCAGRFCSAILPDDGMVDGLTSFAIPDHRGFALVGDANGMDVPRGYSGFDQHVPGGSELSTPYFHGIVLNPSRLGVDLGKLKLRHCNNLPALVKNDAARAGCALVKR